MTIFDLVLVSIAVNKVIKKKMEKQKLVIIAENENYIIPQDLKKKGAEIHTLLSDPKGCA